jgi:hypothetical protein
MKEINYIFVNDTHSIKNAARTIRRSHVSGYRHYIIVNSQELSHRELVERLVSIRFCHPDAKILGLSEIDGKSICANEAMNRLRRELSEWP